MPLKLPFRHSPRLAARFARLHRLKAKGILPPVDKTSLRQAASAAAASHPVTIIKNGKRARTDYDAG